MDGRICQLSGQHLMARNLEKLDLKPLLLIDCLRLNFFFFFLLKLLFRGACVHTYYDSGVFPARAALPVALADSFSDNNSFVEPRERSSSLKFTPSGVPVISFPRLTPSITLRRGELHFNFLPNLKKSAKPFFFLMDRENVLASSTGC